MKKQKNEKEKVVGTLKYAKKENGKQGITLIALVVTIVVLLILAGVSIVVLFGDHGIITAANQAANDHKLAFYMDKFEVVKTGVATQNAGKVPIEKFKEELIKEKVVTAEQITGNGTDGYVATPEENVKITIKQAEDGKNVTIKYELTNEKGTTGGDSGEGSGEGGGDNPGGEITNPDDPTDDSKVPLISDMRKDDMKNQKVKDIYGNKIVIPAGFEVVEHGIDDVEYSYAEGEEKNSPTVQDGIVIEDNDGNQFVWIPIGTIKNKDESTTTINLGRYKFDDKTGNEEIVQLANQYKTNNVEESDLTYQEKFKIAESGQYFMELNETIKGTKHLGAKSLEDFITSATRDKGFYMARYEASYGKVEDVEVALSKVSTGSLWETFNKPTKVGDLWACGSISEATEASRRMYDNEFVQSDLMNSYAFDTTVVFLQKYSKNNKYSIQTSINTKRCQTGPKNLGGAGDKVCNIYDLASNLLEYTTEYCSKQSYNCTTVSGKYNNSLCKMASRGYDNGGRNKRSGF